MAYILSSRFSRPVLNIFSMRLMSSSQNESVVTCKRLNGENAGIAEITLDRDPKTLNALSSQLAKGVMSSLADLKNDADLRVVIFKSSNKKAFSAGLDLKEGAFGEGLRLCRQMIRDIYQFPKPTIAAIDGLALGGGLETALACDILVGSDNIRAGLVESKVGLIPGGAGHYQLASIVGQKRAKEITFSAEMLNGQICYDIGLIQHLVKQNENYNAAYLKAKEIAMKILPQAPIALEKSKAIVNAAASLGFRDSFEMEFESFLSLEATEDAQNGVRRFVNKEKGPTIFTGK